MSLDFWSAVMWTRHKGMGFSGVPKRRMNEVEKPRVSSSRLISSTGMSVGIPFKTTLTDRSSGRENVWNSVPLDSRVV